MYCPAKMDFFCILAHCATPYTTPSKNNLFRKANARDNELRHENGCVKSSSQLRGEHCKCSSVFSLVNALVYVEH